MKAWNPWSQEEVSYLQLNYGKIPVSKISENLNRSRPGIRAKALKLGLISELNLNKIWTEEEDQVLVQEFVPDKTVVISIAKKLGRSRDSVYRRAWSKNLCRKYDSRQRHLWSEEETELLKDLAGEPVSRILKSINTWRSKKGLEKRSKTAIERKLMSLSISRKAEGNYLDVATLAEVLRCSRFVIYKWAHD
ncbi:MAG: hypothetical protein WBB28_27120 [Crinalium sp.]